MKSALLVTCPLVDLPQPTIERKSRVYRDRRDDPCADAPFLFFSRVGRASPRELEPHRSVEGWVVIVRGVHEEADEDTLTDHFAEFGQIKNVHLNLDRRTGYVKGYAFIEYESRKEAENAIDMADGKMFLDKPISVSFAFVEDPEAQKQIEQEREEMRLERQQDRRDQGDRRSRRRSVSPGGR
ncbi:hypothetical protein BC940DRAFT_137869 [Gongronella butleri]|nr:hypothetical protein BC940DRAFT_137869 [Gongronella butleri]